MNQQNTKESSLNWVIAFTVVLIGLGALLLWASNGCEPNAAGVVFRCLRANEMGDFLAGIFAPIAFVWLMYAVLQQSKELAAQRKELRLTREELEHAREVAIEAKKATWAQAEEARRSAEYFNAQTVLMSEEQQIKKTADASDKLKRLLLVTRGKIRSILSISHKPENEQEWFSFNQALITTMIEGYCRQMFDEGNYDPTIETKLSRSAEALPALEAALELEEVLGDADRAILKSIGIGNIHDSLSTAKRRLAMHKVAETTSNQ